MGNSHQNWEHSKVVLLKLEGGVATVAMSSRGCDEGCLNLTATNGPGDAAQQFQERFER